MPLGGLVLTMSSLSTAKNSAHACSQSAAFSMCGYDAFGKGEEGLGRRPRHYSRVRAGGMARQRLPSHCGRQALQSLLGGVVCPPKAIRSDSPHRTALRDRPVQELRRDEDESGLDQEKTPDRQRRAAAVPIRHEGSTTAEYTHTALEHG